MATAVRVAIKARRIALGLRQQEVAEMIGVSYQQFHKYEHGINRVSVGALVAIADALGTTPSALLEDVDAGPDDLLNDRARGALEVGKIFHRLDETRRRALLTVARAFAEVEP